MARNASGTHSLPAGNPVVTGTAISSTVHNATQSDISTEITDSLSRSGKGGMSAPLVITAGSVSAPSIAPTGDTNTGIYASAADEIAITTGGTQRFKASSAGIIVTGAVAATAGINLTGTGAAVNVITSFVADGATAVAHTLNTDGALANGAAKLLSVQNNDVEKASIGEDGALACYGAAMGSQKITGLANGSVATDGATFGQLPVTSSNNFESTGSGWAWTGRIIQEGSVVTISGTFAGTGANNPAILGTLPASVRPAAAAVGFGTRTIAATGVVLCRVDIATSGVIAADYILAGSSFASAGAENPTTIIFTVTYTLI